MKRDEEFRRYTMRMIRKLSLVMRKDAGICTFGTCSVWACDGVFCAKHGERNRRVGIKHRQGKPK